MQNQENSSPNTWEQKTFEKILLSTIKEQRRKRRWGIFFKITFILLILFILRLFFPIDTVTTKKLAAPHTALIDISGAISDSNMASADNIATSLKEAFDDKNAKGIIIRINSPGGSPVQAAYVYDEIRRQKDLRKDIKVYAVCTDVCASAAYYIASATDFIYANPASLVGSIGALMDDFGFVEAMKKIGVERRLLTAGSHKGFLDPFLPLNADDRQYAQAMLNDVHQQFIKSVQAGRGSRLKNDPLIFSGLAWTGKQALPLGLIDGFGSAGYVAREIIKNENIIDYTVTPSYLEQLANRFGASFSQNITGYFTRHIR